MEGSSSIKFIYLGEDLEYAKGLEKSLAHFYGDLNVELVRKSFKTNEEAWKFIADPQTLEYKLFYVDFSANYSIYSFIATAIGQENSYAKKPVIGLGGVDASREQVFSGLISGCDAFFIKGIEISGVVNFGINLAKPDAAKPIEWATGEFAEDEADVFLPVKVNYFTDKYVHIETDGLFDLEQEIVIKTKICDEMGVEKFLIIRKPEQNFYYSLNHSYDLEYISPVKRMDDQIGLKDPDAEKEEEEPLSAKAIEKLDSMKIDIGTWIEKHQHMSGPKNAKTLIIDQQLTFLSQIEKNPEDYPFHLAFHRFFSDDMDTVFREKPNIITIALDEHFEDKEEGHSNTIDIIPKLIKKTQEIKGYTPFIFLFNCKVSQEELKKNNDYDKIFCTSDQFSFALFLNLVKRFEEAGGKKLTSDPKFGHGHREDRFYISKKREDSFAYHPFKVKIKQINETSITIQTTYKLKPFTVIKLDFPTDCFISILPREKEEKLPEKQGYFYNYNAAIHGIGEMEKNQLRVYINKVFVPKEEEPEEEKAS